MRANEVVRTAPAPGLCTTRLVRRAVAAAPRASVTVPTTVRLALLGSSVCRVGGWGVVRAPRQQWGGLCGRGKRRGLTTSLGLVRLTAMSMGPVEGLSKTSTPKAYVSG
jgi:hypothetical protein